jgi:hypothetical protein
MLSIREILDGKQFNYDCGICANCSNNGYITIVESIKLCNKCCEDLTQCEWCKSVQIGKTPLFEVSDINYMEEIVCDTCCHKYKECDGCHNDTPLNEFKKIYNKIWCNICYNNIKIANINYDQSDKFRCIFCKEYRIIDELHIKNGQKYCDECIYFSDPCNCNKFNIYHDKYVITDLAKIVTSYTGDVYWSVCCKDNSYKNMECCLCKLKLRDIYSDFSSLSTKICKGCLSKCQEDFNIYAKKCKLKKLYCHEGHICKRICCLIKN